MDNADAHDRAVQRDDFPFPAGDMAEAAWVQESAACRRRRVRAPICDLFARRPALANDPRSGNARNLLCVLYRMRLHVRGISRVRRRKAFGPDSFWHHYFGAWADPRVVL